MKYPNVALKIHNYLPSVELFTEEGKSRTMVTADKGLDKLLLETAASLGADWNLSQILEHIAEGDEAAVLFPLPEFESDALDYQSIESALKDIIADKPVFENMSPELTAEIDKNWYSDVLASTLFEAYNVLIARTVFLASEVGVGEIQLIDDRLDARLVEKMTRDLAEINIELVVADVPEVVDAEAESADETSAD